MKMKGGRLGEQRLGIGRCRRLKDQVQNLGQKGEDELRDIRRGCSFHNGHWVNVIWRKTKTIGIKLIETGKNGEREPKNKC
jgi:hypothetical protein